MFLESRPSRGLFRCAPLDLPLHRRSGRAFFFFPDSFSNRFHLFFKAICQWIALAGTSLRPFSPSSSGLFFQDRGISPFLCFSPLPSSWLDFFFPSLPGRSIACYARPRFPLSFMISAFFPLLCVEGFCLPSSVTPSPCPVCVLSAGGLYPPPPFFLARARVAFFSKILIETIIPFHLLI